jgi:hypothetical protein
MFLRNVRLFPNEATTQDIVLFITVFPKTSDPTLLIADNLLVGKKTKLNSMV